MQTSFQFNCGDMNTMHSCIIYHNPRCSKSRATLALLEEHNIEHSVRLYLQDPLSTTELKDLLRKLRLTAIDLVRTGESEFKELGLHDKKDDEQALLAAMSSTPKLMQRPVVATQSDARIGRPPEDVLALFS